jgi:hypothetical protein
MIGPHTLLNTSRYVVCNSGQRISSPMVVYARIETVERAVCSWYPGTAGLINSVLGWNDFAISKVGDETF